VSEEDLDAEIDSIILESFQGSVESFRSALEYYGISEESFREDAYLNLLVRQIALEQINPTDEDVRAYFEENRYLFDQAEEVEARHILVESEELVNELAAMLADGDDFVALAAVYSMDQSNKDNGGYLGFFSRGMMVEEFEEAAFALEVGEISEPVQTNFGFHLIELLGRKEASEADFDTVSEQVREALIEEQIPVVINTLVQTLYEKAEIEYIIGSESAEPDTGL
jgi:foldase protein PrsA